MKEQPEKKGGEVEAPYRILPKINMILPKINMILDEIQLV